MRFLIIFISLFIFSNANNIEKTALDCDIGDIKSCKELGIALFKKGDYSRSIKLLNNFCLEKDKEICFYTGYAKFYSSEDLKNEGINDLQKSCNLKNYKSCHILGNIYTSHYKDNSNAKKFYKIACENNYAKSCDNLGDIYQYNDKNIKEALKFYQKSCDNNIANSCYNIGFYNYFGIEVKQNLELAFINFLKACNLKHELACNNVGNMYEYAKFVKQDIKKALEYYNKACNPESFTACYNKTRLEFSYNLN